MGMQPAVFLDLDNTIVHDTNGAAGPGAVTLIKGAAPAIASLRGLGYRIVVVANHDAVARGNMSEEEVEALHAHVAELVRGTANGAVIDAFYYCPFHPKGKVKKYQKDHPTRKPKPGMLVQAAEEMSLELSASWMIGDELADVQAGHAAGARTVLLRPDAERLRPADPSQLEGVTSEAPDPHRPTGPDFFAVGLVDAARLIAQQPRVDQTEPAGPKPGRKWDAAKIAKIQVPRPEQAQPEPVATQQAVREFRPWGAPAKDEDDRPIVAKPFRKRHDAAHEAPATPPAEPEANSVTPPPAGAEPGQEIPDNIRQAIEKKRSQPAGEAEEAGADKTLRLILHELRAHRAVPQEFSFLTIIAVAFQLIAIVCLLGGLFMGGDNDGVFLRWLGAGIMVQLIAITTLLYGR